MGKHHTEAISRPEIQTYNLAGLATNIDNPPKLSVSSMRLGAADTSALYFMEKPHIRGYGGRARTIFDAEWEWEDGLERDGNWESRGGKFAEIDVKRPKRKR